jgi:predicted phage terminase large subunit-like protein
MNNPDKEVAKRIEEELHFRKYARLKMNFFILYTFSDYSLSPFHKVYCDIIQAFIDKKIRKLIISVPPQHGKSEVSTRRLPAMLLGLNPALKIAIVSYSTGKSWRFGRQIKQIMKSKEYKNVFPGTKLPEPRDPVYMNSADVVDIPAGKDTGNLYFVGRGGGLTGEPVDILIMDDLYKNAMEAYSPIIRDSVIDWYDTVADSRLHNDSQQIIVSTRWHENDLIGYIMQTEEVEQLTSPTQLKSAHPDKWYMINFEALKESKPSKLDPREQGEPLYPAKHSKKKLLATRKRLVQNEPEKWEGLYQGNPRPIKGLLYQGGFKEYEKKPEIYESSNYTDVADTGNNYLCSICYDIGVDGYIYVTDIYYTAEKQEITEDATADMFIRNGLNSAHIESNAGGRAFARNVERIIKDRGEYIEIYPFHQSKNKESRILTNAANCMRKILMPYGWLNKYPEFAGAVLNFRKKFKANDFDDAPDSLTGVYEKSNIEEDDIIVGGA